MKIFINALKEHIVSFRSHLNEIEADFGSSKTELIRNGEGSDIQKKLKDLDIQLKEVKGYFNDKLKQHLTNTIPTPHMLDIVCTIHLPQKNISLNNIYIQPFQKFSSIKDVIINELRKANHLISYLNDTSGYIVILPSEKAELSNNLTGANANLEYYKDLDIYISKAQGFGLDCVKINSTNVIASHKIHPYSTLIYVGDFKLKEDIPPECITYDYKPGQMMNYFSCENCNTNCK